MNDKLMDRVIALIEADITAAENGETGLDVPVSKKLNDYARTLIQISKDFREQMKLGEWEKLNDEEMQAKLEEALAALKGDET